MKVIDGGVTAPKGFLAASTAAGIKYKDRSDMAMIYSTVPCKAAGTFTECQKQTLRSYMIKIVTESKSVQAVVVNAGIANACTGAEGFGYCEDTAKKAAAELNSAEDAVLVASTGVIGMQLPIQKLESGIEVMAKELSDTREAAHQAACAIMTADTISKEAVTFEAGGKTVTVGGMCKGSGMIHPEYGTMLGFVMTDALISKELTGGTPVPMFVIFIT